jgi:maltose alpha-D-glucosyltransferase/alpha-amylase
MYKAYVKDPRARINLGIRHRLAPLMGNNRKKIELLNYLLFSLPGTPVIYYGDEIGMGDNFYLGDRNGVRTPMQWTSGRNAGFSETNPHKLYLPVILDPEYHYESINVEMQSWNTSSLLWWMKRIINKRRQYKAFSRGDLKFIQSENPKILAFTRSYENETILVVVNLSRYTQPAELDLSAFRGYKPVEVFSKNKFPGIKEDTPYFLTLAGHDCEWFVLEKVHPEMDSDKALPLIQLNHWDELVSEDVLEQLERDILKDYMMKMRWFGGKGRLIETIRVINYANIPLPEDSAYFLLIEVQYQSGLPEIYQLPLAFGRDQFANKVKDHCPQAVLAMVKIGDREGVLYDAIYGFDLQQAIITNMARGANIGQKGSQIRFYANERLRKYVEEFEKVKPRVLSAEQSNTSITYDNRFFLKLYRKVDRAMNPDLEIAHFLTEHAKFEHVPAFIGAIEWKFQHDSLIMGMMQVMVESNSDAWTYIMSRLDDYNERILEFGELTPPPLRGSLTDPLAYEDLPAEMRELIDGQIAEQIRLLGVRTGQMHMALASRNDIPDFKPEEYSLHYQRSLFAGLQSLVRGTFQNQSRNISKLSDEVRREAEEVLAMKDEILQELKGIYRKKIDVVKIRIHGDYHLGQVLFTGKDFIITDFEGEPARSYSERRLKRSPLRDVAGMLRSFHYAAYCSLLLDNQIRTEDLSKLMPFAELWYHYMSGIFMNAYLKTVGDSAFIPKEKGDLNTLMTTFLLEKAIYELNYELNNRPGWVMIPMRGIKSIMRKGVPEPHMAEVIA